jgi:hypothetical protein
VALEITVERSDPRMPTRSALQVIDMLDMYQAELGGAPHLLIVDSVTK